MIENISFGREITLGVFIGLLFIVLNATLGLVIGIPILAFGSESEKYIITSGVAPLVEELVFRAFLPFVLAMLGVPFILNAGIGIMSFLTYHFSAYGSSVTAASSLFIGAGLFALVAFLVTYYNSNVDEFQVPLAAIIGHSIINTWLGIKAASLIIINLASSNLSSISLIKGVVGL